MLHSTSALTFSLYPPYFKNTVTFSTLACYSKNTLATLKIPKPYWKYANQTRFAGAKRDLDHHYHHHHHHHHPHHHPPSFPASSARSAILSPSFSISSHWTFICQTPFISSFVQWDFLFNPSPNLSMGMQLRGIFEFKGPNFWFYWITISVGKNPFE